MMFYGFIWEQFPNGNPNYHSVYWNENCNVTFEITSNCLKDQWIRLWQMQDLTLKTNGMRFAKAPVPQVNFKSYLAIKTCMLHELASLLCH